MLQHKAVLKNQLKHKLDIGMGGTSCFVHFVNCKDKHLPLPLSGIHYLMWTFCSENGWKLSRL